MIQRAPRKKKRLSCELIIGESRYSGIVVDISASGMFVQTSGKPTPGERAELSLSLPGVDGPVRMEARVARKKVVPPQLLTLAQGGVGLAFDRPADAYLDYIAEISAEHAEAAQNIRARMSRRPAGGGGNGSARGARVRRDGPVVRRFRVHAVETATGKKNSFLLSCVTEQEAQDELLKQLGDAWQTLFVERA